MGERGSSVTEQSSQLSADTESVPLGPGVPISASSMNGSFISSTNIYQSLLSAWCRADKPQASRTVSSYFESIVKSFPFPYKGYATLRCEQEWNLYAEEIPGAWEESKEGKKSQGGLIGSSWP